MKDYSSMPGNVNAARWSMPRKSMATKEQAPQEQPALTFFEDAPAVQQNNMSDAWVRNQMQNLHKKPAEERARVGALFGAGIGASSGNKQVGAVLGAAIGSLAARGLGMVQSGELQKLQDRSRIQKNLNAIGLLDDEGGNPFANTELKVRPDTKLRNLYATDGTTHRDVYQIDKSNPYANRATSLARPIARYFTEGMLGMTGNAQVADETTGMFVNMLTDNASDITEIQSRARVMADKFGIKEEDIRSYFNKVKADIPENEAREIRQGLDTIYGIKNGRL